MRILPSLLLTLSASAVIADDTDIFTGGNITTASDVVMVLDTSGSMNDEETIPRPAYENGTVYDNSKYGFKPDGYYLFRPANSNLNLDATVAAYLKNNEVKESQINCSEALNAAKNSGEYAGRMAYWYYGSSGGWDAPASRDISNYGEGHNNDYGINDEDSTGLVECDTDDYFYYQGNRYSYLYEYGDYPFTNRYWYRDDVFDTSFFFPSYNEGFTRLWRGNYLNYIAIEGTEDKVISRIDILKDATIDTIKSLASNVRVALIPFSKKYNDSGYRDGGYVDVAMQSASKNQSLFETKINGLVADGGTPISESMHEAQLYLTEQEVKYGTQSVSESKNGNNYAIFDENNCGKTTKVIVFSDGLPSVDTRSNSYIRDLVKNSTFDSNASYLSKNCGNGISESSDNGEGECAEELAHYMYNKQDIVVDTIGGFTSAGDGATQKLKDIAKAGGGTFYPANDYVEIKNALITAATETIITPNSFIAPTIAVNSFNSLKATDEIYYTVFQTTPTSGWKGNLKRYKLGEDGSVLAELTEVYDSESEQYSSDDADYKLGEAIDQDTGFFKDEARSYWSESADGPTVEDGGMANRFTKDRNIYTNTQSSNSLVSISNNIDTSNLIKPENSHISAALKNDILPKSLLSEEDLSDEEHINIIEWIAGLKREENADGDTLLVARKEMEDSLHTKPLIINYSENKRVLYLSSNGGYLHAFDIEWGDKDEDRTAGEIFSFIPKEVLTNPFEYMQAEENSDKLYGLDGKLSFWHDDKDYDGVVDKSDGDKVYLYVGMRRGGSSYYALNVTDPDNPSIAWQVHGTYQDSDKNTPSQTTGYGQLGQTWSKLIPAEIQFKGKSKIVLVASGGYDNENDASETRTEDSYGNTLFFIDPKTGAKFLNLNKDATLTGDMDYSFISDPMVVDRDGNGYADLIYAADLGGQVWRFDLNENATSKKEIAQGGVIAALSGSDSGDLRFFNDPDISYFEYKTSPYSAPTAKEGEAVDYNGFILISIGSGNRANPLEEDTVNYHFLLRDNVGKAYPSAYTAASFEELPDWADEANYNSEKGWKLKMSTSGEKVVSTSVTFFGDIFFTTYSPTDSEEEEDENTCTGDSGSSRIYTVKMYQPKEDPTIKNTGQSFMPGDPVITRLPSSDSDSDSKNEPEYTVIVGTSEQASRTPPITVERDYWKENPVEEKEKEEDEKEDSDTNG